VRKLFLPIAILTVLMIYSGTARAYDPYAYASYDAYPVEAPSYDPYYELHQIHYQLYLRSYPTVVYPYYVIRPVPVFVGAPPVVVAPVSKSMRILQPVRRAR
jgi:hypothetical protein